MELKVIRGQRFLDWLEEDSTYKQLDTNIRQAYPETKKRQNDTGSVMINQVQYVPYVQQGELHVTGVARSGNNQYEPTVAFRNVAFQPEDAPANTTFRGADNNEYHIVPIQLNNSNVRVRCTCMDFYYRFASYNAGDSSLAGSVPRQYQPTGQRPPVNPSKVPGVCKHIIKVVDQLRQGRIVT